MQPNQHINKFCKFTIVLTIMVTLSTSSNATSFVWTGAVDTSFTNAGNWNPSNMGYPGATDTIEIVSATNHIGLDDNYEVYHLIVTSGTLNLNGFEFTVSSTGIFDGGHIHPGMLYIQGDLAVFSGGTIDAKLQVNSQQIELSGGVFNDSCFFSYTGNMGSTGLGGCVFNDFVVLVHYGSDDSYWLLATEYGDVFNHDLMIILAGEGSIGMSTSDSSVYNGNIEVNNMGSGHVIFGYEEGASTLADGKTITVGTYGFDNHILGMQNFYQLGNSSQQIELTETGKLVLVSCVFEGALSTSSPDVLFWDNRFEGNCTIVKTGENNSFWYGGNHFLGDVHLSCINDTTESEGWLLLASSEHNIFEQDVFFESEDVTIYVLAYGGGIFKGDINFNSDMINFDEGLCTLNGSYNQNISGPAPLRLSQLTIDKSGGNVLTSTPISIGGSLTLDNGNLMTSDQNYLLMGEGSEVIGGGDNSFVEGPMKKIGDNNFEFPIGKNGKLRSVFISNISNSEDIYVAEFIDHGQDLGYAMADTSRINYLSDCSYWRLEQEEGSSEIAIGFFHDSTSCDYWDPIEPVLSFWYNDSVWVNPERVSLNSNRIEIDSVSQFGYFVFSTYFPSDYFIWTGDSSNSWSDANNWTPSYRVPGATDIILIPDSTTYDLVLDRNRTVHTLVVNGATIDLGSYELKSSFATALNEGEISNGTLVCRGEIATAVGLVLNCVVDVFVKWLNFPDNEFNNVTGFRLTATDSLHHLFTGCTFNDEVEFNIEDLNLGAILDFNNSIFNGEVTITKNSDAALLIGGADSISFHDKIYLNINGGGYLLFGWIVMADSAKSNFTIGGPIHLKDNAGFITGNEGINDGMLGIVNIVQAGNANHELLLTGESVILFGMNSFNGIVDFTAPSILFVANEFIETVNLTKTGDIQDGSVGGNIYHDDVTISNEGTGILMLATDFSEIYYKDVFFETATADLIVGIDGDNIFHGNVSTNNRQIFFNTGAGSSTFTGATAQQIVGSDEINFGNLVIDKSNNNLTFTTPISISGTMEFINGHVISDTTNLLTFSAGAEATGAHNGSFISGPVKKVGNTEFEFPVGKGNDFRPISMSAPDSTTDAFVAEYMSDSVAVNTVDRDTTLGTIRRNKYWNLFRYHGTSEIYVTLSWNESNWLPDTIISVASWSGSLWRDLGRATIVGDSIEGKIVSAVTAEYYYQFAIAFQRNAALYSGNNCFSITDGVQLQTCLNHAGTGDLLQITSNIVLPDVSGPAGSISFPLIVGSGVILQGFSGGVSPKWWEPGCPLITSGFKTGFSPQTPQHPLFIFAMEPGATIQNLRLRGGSCHYQDFNMDGFLCGGIFMFSDNSTTVAASVLNCEVSCFNYAGIFIGEGAGYMNIENCYIHKVKGRGNTTGIGYGVWTMGHHTINSVVNFTNNIFDDCKSAIDGQGDPIDWNIRNCTFSQFLFSEDINKHNDNRFIIKCPCTGPAILNTHWDYDFSTTSQVFYGSYWDQSEPCIATNCPGTVITNPGPKFGPLTSAFSSALYPNLQGIPIYDVGGANTNIEDCIFHKKWKINQNGNISLNYPNVDDTRGGDDSYAITIRRNTFATDEFDKDIVLNNHQNNSGFARISDNYILADVWENDYDHIIHNNNFPSYKPGVTVTGSAPQPFEISLQLMNDAGTDPLEASYTNSATSGHRFIQFIDKNEDFKINLANSVDATDLTYIIRPNPSTGSGITTQVISNENYFYMDEVITDNTYVSLPAYDKPGLYGIDVLAFDATQNDFKASSWQHIPLIVKDDSEDQVLYFNIKDSYLEANQQSSTGVMKQAFLNNQLLWEEDIADGGDGWEYVKVDLNDFIPNTTDPYKSVIHTDGTPNELSFRIYLGSSVDAMVVKGVFVWIDDIYIKKTGSPVGDNLVRDGSIEIIKPEELTTGVSLDPLWFRYMIQPLTCSSTTRNPTGSISSTDRKSGTNSLLLVLPDMSGVCTTYPISDEVIAAVGTVLDFTDLLSCDDYEDFDFEPIDEAIILSSDDSYQNEKLIIESDIVIPNGRTLTFEGCQIVVRPNNPPFTITINSGGTLIISPESTGTHIFACGDMWGGIINQGGMLNANAASNINRPTKIEDAITAISSTAGEVRVRYANFNDNFRGIELINYNQTHSSSANDKGFLGVKFTSSNGILVKSPHEGDQPLAHIDLVDVTNVTIGGLGSTSAYRNKFSDAVFGIRAVNSTGIIFNNEFDNIGANDMTCKLCEGAIHSTESNLTIGGPISGTGSNVYHRNYFKNSKFGIVNLGESTSVFQGNDFQELPTGIICSNNFNSDLTISEENNFVNVDNGVIVREFTGTLQIDGNNFNELGFSPIVPLNYSNSAIVIQNSFVNTSNDVRISGNEITNCRIGIKARNIPNISIGADLAGGEGNTIMFGKEKGGYHHGIWIEFCPSAKIQDNEIDKVDAGFLVEGITIYESTGVLVNKNVITETDVPVNLYGVCNDSELHCNSFDNSFNTGAGVQMNNATLPQQGSPSTTWDNHWFGYDNTYNGVTGMANSPFNWYYRNTPTEYKPFPNATTASAISLSTFNGDNCVVMAAPGDPDREVRYGAIAADTLNFADYVAEFSNKSKRFLFELISADTGLLTRNIPSDTTFNNFYNTIYDSNIGLFYRIDSLLAIGELNDAFELNYSVSDTNLFETNLKTCNAILISKVLIDSALNATDSTTLENIASQDPITGGMAVFMARAMLFMEVHQELPSLRLEVPLEVTPTVMKKESRMTLVPNPANEICSIYFENMESDFKLQIINSIGQEVFQKAVSGNTLYFELHIEKFKPGLYMVFTCDRNNVFHKSKLIISR